MAYLSQKTYIYTKISNTYTWTEVTDTNAWQSGELLTDFVERMNFDSLIYYRPAFMHNAEQRISDLTLIKLFPIAKAGATYSNIVYVEVGEGDFLTGYIFLLNNLQDLFQLFADMQPLVTIPFKYKNLH